MIPAPLLHQLSSDATVLPAKLALVEAKIQAAVDLKPSEKAVADQLVSVKSTLEALKKLADSLQRSVTTLQTLSSKQTLTSSDG